MEALMAYCVVEEAASISNKMLEARPGPELAQLPHAGADPLHLAQSIQASPFSHVTQVHRCFVCVAKALSLFPVLEEMVDIDNETRTRHALHIYI